MRKTKKKNVYHKKCCESRRLKYKTIILFVDNFQKLTTNNLEAQRWN